MLYGSSATTAIDAAETCLEYTVKVKFSSMASHRSLTSSLPQLIQDLTGESNPDSLVNNAQTSLWQWTHKMVATIRRLCG